jgi:CubicO group peptidase (beta-lactamase class C family)
MSHSYTSQAMAKQSGLAVGYRYWFAAPFAIPNLPMPRGSLPSGQLISSAEDMAHYLVAHLNGGRYGDAQVLSPAGIDELHRPAVQANIMGVSLRQYAMGWFDDENGQTKILWHTGEVPGFFAYMALLPEQKKAMVLLVNVDQSLMYVVLTEVGAGAARLSPANSLARAGLAPYPGRCAPCCSSRRSRLPASPARCANCAAGATTPRAVRAVRASGGPTSCFHCFPTCWSPRPCWACWARARSVS